MPYTVEQKQEAVDLYTTVGTAEAARQTGVTTRTITNWAKAAGVTSEERAKTVKHVDKGRAAANEARRQRLRDTILEKAEDMLNRMDQAHHDFKVVGKRVEQVDWGQARSTDVKNYAVAFGVLLDKYRLEMGETTSRTEVSVMEAESVIDAELKKLAEKLSVND